MEDRPSFLLSGVCLSVGAIASAKFVMVVKSFWSSFASFIFARDFAAYSRLARRALSSLAGSSRIFFHFLSFSVLAVPSSLDCHVAIDSRHRFASIDLPAVDSVLVTTRLNLCAIAHLAQRSNDSADS